MIVRTHPATHSLAAVDRVIEPTDTVGIQFRSSIFAGERGAMQDRRTAVEVQAFVPGNVHVSQAVVSLALHVGREGDDAAHAGMADLMLSPAEAMKVAQFLILAAAEAEDLARR